MLKMVPTDAIVMLETGDLPSFVYNLSGGNGTLSVFSESPSMKGFFSSVIRADSIINLETVRPFIAGKDAVVSWHFTNGKGAILMLIRTKQRIGHKRFGELLRESGIAGQPENSAGGIFSTVRPGLFLSINNGIIICGSTKDIVERALAQNNSESTIREREGFTRVSSAAGRETDRLYLFFESTGQFSGTKLTADENLRQVISTLALCSEGDIHLRDNGILINGYTSVNDRSRLNRFLVATPSTYETYRVLPSSTVLYEAFLNVPFPRKDGPEQPATPFANDILPLMAEEITFAMVEYDKVADENSSLLVYELKNGPLALQLLKNHLATLFGGDKEKEYTTYFSPDGQDKTGVFRWDDSGLSSLLSPGFRENFKGRYITIYDNYLVTSPSLEVINKFLYDNILRRTLANDVNYRAFESYLPSRGSYFFYCIPSATGPVLNSWFKDDIVAAILSMKKVSAFGLQLAPGNEMLYSNLAFTVKHEIKEEAGTEWQTLLDTVAYTKPFFFTNHNTGAKEIFVQDHRNNIYLINSAGRILWKAPIREKIESNIFMVDYYRNGKLQLLFSGKEYLHVIDRNGKYVEQFPVKMKVPASGPVSVFDYESNRDYRLAVPGSDRNIYIYDISGDIVKGWTPFKTAGLVKGEIKYFRVSGKDYIVAADERGVYFLDRRGNVRLNVREQIIKADNSDIGLESGRSQAVTFTSPDGTINRISFNGAVEKIKAGDFPADHYFTLFDVDSNGEDDYLFLSGGSPLCLQQKW